MAILNRAKRLEKKRAREEEARVKQQKLEAKYEASIAQAKATMLSKTCPLQGNYGGNCSDKCVHFKDGLIYNDYSVTHVGLDTWTTFSLPKCKLWK